MQAKKWVPIIHGGSPLPILHTNDTLQLFFGLLGAMLTSVAIYFTWKYHPQVHTGKILGTSSMKVKTGLKLML
jgi:hypothetical protein